MTRAAPPPPKAMCPSQTEGKLRTSCRIEQQALLGRHPLTFLTTAERCQGQSHRQQCQQTPHVFFGCASIPKLRAFPGGSLELAFRQQFISCDCLERSGLWLLFLCLSSKTKPILWARRCQVLAAILASISGPVAFPEDFI